MKYGKKDAENLKREELIDILETIMDKCVLYAGDSYSDFARPVIELLVRKKLVEYGEVEHIERPDLSFIPLPIEDRDDCCYHCQHSYEDESINGDWNLHCSCKENTDDGTLVFPSEVCEKFKKYGN